MSAITSPRKKGPQAAPKKRGRGQPPFAPTDQQRALVKMMTATGQYSQDDICELILNQHSQKPIDRHTLAKVFARDIKIARSELSVTLDSNLITHAKKGSLGHQIWFEKTRLGIRDPDSVRASELAAKIDAAGATVKHVVEYRGGLPKGSTPENPAGEAPDIPPEESHK